MISFMLHITALFAVYLLYKRVQTFQQGNHITEVTALLETYLQEMKGENNRLEQMLSKHTREAETPDEADLMNEQPKAPTEEAYVNGGYSIETSLQAKVLQLSSEGLTSDEIAGQIGCGKTEAALILKLHQNT